MKNKKKGDAEPDNSSATAKKKLLKLKSVVKPENPTVKDIKKKTAEVLESRKNANNIVDIIGYLEVTEPGMFVTAAINGCRRIFTHAIEKEQMKKCPSEDNQDKDTEVSDEDKYRYWLNERFEEVVKKLSVVIHHPKKQVNELALVTIIKLMVSRHNNAVGEKNIATWMEEDSAMLQNVILSLCSTQSSSKTQIVRFQEYFEYVDVKFYFLQQVSRILNKVEKKSKTTPVFLDNILSCLEVIGTIEKCEDNMTLLCHNYQCKEKSTFELDFEQMKRNFGVVWIRFLKCKLNLDLYKRVLIMLHDKVLPYLPRPLLLTDFLLQSYEVGGSISLLALSGVFTLVQQYNLEYPDFYKKLYALFTPEVLHVKYRARFFHLADLFLASSHLPEYVVAAFAKRLARIALQGPATTLVMCLHFIQNLLIRHRGLTRLLDDPTHQDLDTDPYLPLDPDPATCRAIHSSLWEVKTLGEHVLPQVSAVAKLLLKGVGEQEADVSASLETTWQDMMDTELKRKVWINVPINFEKPNGMMLPKEDILAELFAME